LSLDSCREITKSGFKTDWSGLTHQQGSREFDEQQLAPRHQTLKRHEGPSWFGSNHCEGGRNGYPDRAEYQYDLWCWRPDAGLL